MTDRSIATRLEDACAIEAEACFEQDARLKSTYSDGHGTWRVFTRPLLPDEPQQVPESALYLYCLPYPYKTSIGQAGTLVNYGVTFQFVMTMTALSRARGQRGWHDDVLRLIHWFYAGGAHGAPITGNVFDPDNANEYITTSLEGFEFEAIGSFPNGNMLVTVRITWQTLEDAQGNKL